VIIFTEEDMNKITRDPHGRSLRKGRFSEPNRIYLITTVTRERCRIFSGLHNARCLIGVLRDAQTLNHACTLCFVVMPDHLHWLMQLGDVRDLSAVVQSVKALSSKRIGHRIWQQGFYDHAVRDEENIKAIARYIVANPVRAGLVSRIGDYPHWDAVWL